MYVKLFLRRSYVMFPIECYVKPGSVMAVIVDRISIETSKGYSYNIKI